MLTIPYSGDASLNTTTLVSDCTYFTGQVEKGTDTGYVHWQCYVEFKKDKSFSQIKKYFKSDTMHIEERKGTQLEAIAYCTKHDTRVGNSFSIGVPKKQGARTDLYEIGDMIIRGASMRECALANPSLYIRYNRGMKDLQLAVLEPQPMEVTVEWYWGKPGVGKTRKASDRWKESDICRVSQSNNSVWFPRYCGQQCILVDELNHNWLGPELLLQLCDRYPIDLPFKGGSYPKCSPYVIITSNVNPRYVTNVPEAFWRRLTHLEEII